MDNIVQLDSHRKTQLTKWVHDAERAIQMIDWNIDRKIAGLRSATTETIAEQAERRVQHCEHIAKLRKELEAL